jgi:hypothetical protein
MIDSTEVAEGSASTGIPSVGVSISSRPSSRRRRSRDRREKEGHLKPLPEVTLDLIAQRSSALTLPQLNKMIHQLGYIPYNLVEIAAESCDDDPVPQVAKLYPLNKNDLKGRYSVRPLPFPTMLWLCCTTIHNRICELEVGGWVQKLQKRLTDSEESPVYLEAMSKAHKAYAQERWSLLTPEDQQLVLDNGW